MLTDFLLTLEYISSTLYIYNHVEISDILFFFKLCVLPEVLVEVLHLHVVRGVGRVPALPRHPLPLGALALPHHEVLVLQSRQKALRLLQHIGMLRQHALWKSKKDVNYFYASVSCMWVMLDRL